MRGGRGCKTVNGGLKSCPMIGVFRGTRVRGVKVQSQDTEYVPSSDYTGARLLTFSLC